MDCLINNNSTTIFQKVMKESLSNLGTLVSTYFEQVKYIYDRHF